MDTTLKIEELSSPEEIAVGIAGERSTKSRILSHYEDRRERKGWLVKGVHGISIARRNNWVQSGRLPYVTSAPFKRESASASSSHSHPRPHPSILPILEQPRTCLRAGKKTSSTWGKREQKKATTGWNVRRRGKDGCGRGRGRIERGGGRKRRREADRERTRETWIWKKRGARAHCGNRGRRSGALLLSKLAVSDRGGRRKKPWKKNAEEWSRDGRGAMGLWTRTTRRTTRNKSNERTTQNNRQGPRRARSHNCLGAQWRGCPVNRRRTTPPPSHLDSFSFRLSHLFTMLASFSQQGCSSDESILVMAIYLALISSI